MGRWGDGEMGRWGDGEMGRWGRFVSLLPLGDSFPHGAEKVRTQALADSRSPTAIGLGLLATLREWPRYANASR
ncbi:MAG: hypothetical protein F6K26_10495 [Moorea sp. SIO2I5]|nr:hypothetical protein [Moorena sp. SIO2I5]